MKLEEMTVKDYIELLASDAPAPGGGSASALSGAQGAGLVTMAAGLTVGKKKYLDVSEKCSQLIKKGMPNVEALKNQIDRDTEPLISCRAPLKCPRRPTSRKRPARPRYKEAPLYLPRCPLRPCRWALRGLRTRWSLPKGLM